MGFGRMKRILFNPLSITLSAWPLVIVSALGLTAFSGAQQPGQKSPPTTPWELQNSTTKAGLRGIHAVGNGIAWASGTNGTILRTEDGGYMWQSCAMPPGAEKLDFRGIWAWDANTAVAMSSGPGDLSRLYKTTDGCSSWKLLFTNPDAGTGEGFWDALLFLDKDHGMIVGDPAHGNMANPVEGGYFAFRIRLSHDGGQKWVPVTDPEMESPGRNLQPLPKEALFAASNSAVVTVGDRLFIGTSLSRVLQRKFSVSEFQSAYCAGQIDPSSGECGIPWTDWQVTRTPLASGNDSSGVFSLAFRDQNHGIAVGGDYKKPNESTGTAAYTADGGKTWTAATKSPHGYRSAVAWDAADKAWITVGTNGSDVSYDDGNTWQPLDNGNWNALSLPWVVGPKGRIAKLVSLKSAVSSGK
jgi:photosystem II stability/assembly factor-like uncharacterized protein